MRHGDRNLKRQCITCCLSIFALVSCGAASSDAQTPPSETRQLPPPSQQGATTNGQQGTFEQLPGTSSSLQAGQEAYQRAEQQRLNAMSRQLGWNNEMRRRSALPPWQWYYDNGYYNSGYGGYVGSSVTATSSLSLWDAPTYGVPSLYGNSPGFLADSLLQEPWYPYGNVDIFGYRYDNPVRQPIGRESVQTGPNTWESRPVYADDFAPPAVVGAPAGEAIVRPVQPELNLAKDLATARTQAFAALERGDFQAALESASQMLELDPNNAEAMFLSMHADLGLLRFADAVVDLDLALESAAPEDWNEIVKNYKLYYGTAGAFTRQLRRAESAVRANPADADARLVLGYLYAGLGHAAEAQAQLAEVQQQTEADSLTHRLAGRLLQMVNPAEILPRPPQAEDRAQQPPPVQGGRIF